MSRNRSARKRFAHRLETMEAEAIHNLLRLESTDELCAINEYASPRLRIIIQREIRNTDD